MVPLFSLLDVRSTYNVVKRRYTANEIKVIENESYKKLNNVKYPSTTREVYGVSEEYKNSVNNFAYNIYKELGKENISYSPLGLYSNLNIVSLASDSEVVLNQIDNVLGLNMEKRKENFKKSEYIYNLPQNPPRGDMEFVCFFNKSTIDNRRL